MKIVGTNEEVNRFLDLLQQNTCPGFLSAYVERMRATDGLIGTYCGIKIDVEIEEPPMYIGIITSGLTENEIHSCISQIVEKHKKRLCSSFVSTDKCWGKCFDDSRIESFDSCSRLYGCKFDELWMDSLPPNWDEIDLCMKSVVDCRNKIHFFRELNRLR